jgi:hypothetical protein
MLHFVNVDYNIALKENSIFSQKNLRKLENKSIYNIDPSNILRFCNLYSPT